MPGYEVQGHVALPEIRPAHSAHSNPYVGPRSFREDDVLFGRDREARELVARVRADRIVLLHSPSGAGKTSLLQSKLLPALRGAGYHVLSVVRVGLTEAGADGAIPNRYLRSTLTALAPDLPNRLLDAAPKHQMLAQTLDAVRASRPSGWNEMQLLVFDQFEELLTLDPSDVAAKQEFLAELAVALQDHRLAAIFSMREEWLGQLEPLVTHLPTRLNRRFRLDHLTCGGALEAIRRPAEGRGVRFDDEAADLLLDSLRRVTVVGANGAVTQAHGEHVEPLQLQLVCYGIWERQSDTWTDGVVRSTNVSASGEVDRALADYYADQVSTVAGRTGVDEGTIRRWIGDRLITPGGLRNHVLSEGQIVDGLPLAVAEELEKVLLVRREVHGGRTWFELVHDRFVNPIRHSNQEWFEANDPLLSAAHAWQAGGQDRSLLLTRAALQRLDVRVSAPGLKDLEREFLRASQDAIARRLKWIAGLVLALIVVVVLGAVWSYEQRSVRLADYRWLVHRDLESQLELQARTYGDIPHPAPTPDEIEWSSRKEGFPVLAAPESFGPVERASDSATAVAALQSTLSEIEDARFDVDMRVSGSVLGPRTQTTALELGITLIPDAAPETTWRPNSIVFSQEVPLAVVRALSLSLLIDGSPLARIRRSEAGEGVESLLLSYFREGHGWPPLTSEQILEMTNAAPRVGADS